MIDDLLLLPVICHTYAGARLNIIRSKFKAMPTLEFSDSGATLNGQAVQ